MVSFSNNGVVEKRSGDLYRTGVSDYNFRGTLIKVEVDLNTFDEKDEMDQIFDF